VCVCVCVCVCVFVCVCVSLSLCLLSVFLSAIMLDCTMFIDLNQHVLADTMSLLSIKSTFEKRRPGPTT
jgi:hypothetical protein